MLYGYLFHHNKPNPNDFQKVSINYHKIPPFSHPIHQIKITLHPLGGRKNVWGIETATINELIIEIHRLTNFPILLVTRTHIWSNQDRREKRPNEEINDGEVDILNLNRTHNNDKTLLYTNCCVGYKT